MARGRMQGGDSKQGLTISLVLFVLLSIVLGLMAYFGYAEQGDLVAGKKNAEDKAKILQAELNKTKLLLAINAVANGNQNKKDEAEYMGIIGGLRNAKEFRQLYDDEIKRHNKFITWDPVADKPDKNYHQQVAELEARYQAEAGGKKKTGDDLERARADFQRDMEKATTALKALADAMAELKDDVDKRIKDIDKNYNTVVEEFQKNIIAAEKFEEEKAKLRKQRDDLDAKLDAATKDAQMRIKKLEEQIPDKIDYLAFDKPKGKVVRVDPNGTTCYIDLGSADLLKPGETFSVFAVGAYKANAKSKASLEVVRILGEHLAMARATEIANAVRDPILTSDELYNPVWTPGVPERVAIVGLVDLTGDGRDGTLELVRHLEKHGMIVDAYLDTRDMTVKGRGMNIQTRYLLLGYIPDFHNQEGVRENDPRQDRIMKLNKEYRTMREESDKYGVKQVLVRDFLARMGFKLSRSQASRGDWNTNMLKQTAAVPAAAPEGAAKDLGKDGKDMKKEEMKKEEMKKD